MQAEKLIEGIAWKKISTGITVGHFPSSNPSFGYGQSQIYVKKYAATKKEDEIKITVFLLHDIGEHHGRFQSFIDWMRKENESISFVVMDFVGHGLSSGTRGHFDKFDYLSNDLAILLGELEKEKKADEKWVLLGHGLGGLVALDLFNRAQNLAEKTIDGLILSNFIFRLPSILSQLKNSSFLQNGVVKNLMSHTRLMRVHQGNEQDPLAISKPTLNSLQEIEKKMETIYQDSYFLGKPLMLLKSEDSLGKKSQGIDRFAKGIKKELLTEKKYSLMKHDLYNEREKENVFFDILSWIKTYEV